MSGRNDCNDVAGTRNRCGNNVAGGSGRNRCECVFECLLQLLEEAGGSNHVCCGSNSVSPGGGSLSRRCDCECVFECLLELLEDALEEDSCKCPR